MPKTKKEESGLSKFFDFNSKPTPADFPELPDYIMWLRLVLAVGYGVFLGNSATAKASSLMLGLNFVAFVPTLYCTTMLGADNNVWGTKLLFSGVLNALAAMILVWMFVYTASHGGDEQMLAKAIAGAVGRAVGGDTAGEFDGGDISDAVVADDAAAEAAFSEPAVEESEF